MKSNLIISFGIMLMSGILSSNANACSCGGHNFTEEDSTSAVTTFMYDKKGITEDKIISIERTKAEEPFVPVAQLPMLVVLDSCERFCLKYMSSKFEVRVKYDTEEQECTQVLKVKLQSKVYTSAKHKSTVTRTGLPICE